MYVLYMYTYSRIHTYIHTYIHVHTCTSTHALTHAETLCMCEGNIRFSDVMHDTGAACCTLTLTHSECHCIWCRVFLHARSPGAT